MAVNEFMHPRNRYRQRPNFQELIKLFPELNEVARVDLSGKVKLDYKNKRTVHLLSKCLLLRDFGLKLELPSDKLAPALPLRLNYIHWLEDIGAIARWQGKESVRGIDIGCGASCIYPLLAVVQSKHRWNMVAIEKADDSLQSAKDNVIRNNMQNSIDVRPQTANGQTILLDVLEEFPNERFDFCMCNPPFFDNASKHEEPWNRTGKRKEPSNASSGTVGELYTDGGEVNFINQIIQESLKLKERITVYTTMIGHKRSYEEILRTLKNTSIHNLTASRFCQGNTTRWAVAWSLDATIMLSRMSDPQATSKKSPSPGKPVSCRIFQSNEMSSLQAVNRYLVGLLQEKDICLRSVAKGDKGDEILYTLTAAKNTWSHQRRKRRAEQAKLKELEIQSPPYIKPTETPQHNGDHEKKPRLEQTESNFHQGEQDTCEPCLKAALQIHRKDDGYYVALQYISGTAGKDGVNQILQYLRNNAKSELPVTAKKEPDSSTLILRDL